MTLHNKPEGKKVANFMVEIDRAKETVEPREEIQGNDAFWRSSSILKKFVIYASAFKEPTCQPFGFKAFRVLMVTTSLRHMKTMQDYEEKYLGSDELYRSPGFTLYTNEEHIADNAGGVLGMTSQRRDGK